MTLHWTLHFEGLLCIAAGTILPLEKFLARPHELLFCYFFKKKIIHQEIEVVQTGDDFKIFPSQKRLVLGTIFIICWSAHSSVC